MFVDVVCAQQEYERAELDGARRANVPLRRGRRPLHYILNRTKQTGRSYGHI
jgi:hypothetical protein